MGPYVPVDNDPKPYCCAQVRKDAAFIAHAREDVPALLVEIERLRFELTAMTESRRLACVGWDAAIEERERLRKIALELAEVSYQYDLDRISEGYGDEADKPKALADYEQLKKSICGTSTPSPPCR